jgi:hypothetical protein
MKRSVTFLIALVISFGILVMLGCGSSSSIPAPTTSTTLSTSTDAGQSVSITGSAAALPSGVPASSLTLTPKAAIDVPVAPVESSLLLAVECGPTGTQFSQPVTLTFKLSPARTAGEVLTVYILSGGAWTPVGTKAIVADNGLTASAMITHFSTYGLFVPVNAALPGNKYFSFAAGVNDGGGPPEIQYDDVTGRLWFPHSSGLQVTQSYAGITQAPYGIYQNSNGISALSFPVDAGTVYVMRSLFPSIQYYKMEIISATLRGSSGYGFVTFKYEKILPQDIVNATGEWVFLNGAHLAVLPSTIGIDYTAADSSFFAIDGNYTNQTTLAGTFMTWSPSTVTGAVTVTLSLTTDGKLNATLTGAAPLGTVTLTGGVKQ